MRRLYVPLTTSLACSALALLTVALPGQSLAQGSHSSSSTSLGAPRGTSSSTLSRATVAPSAAKPTTQTTAPSQTTAPGANFGSSFPGSNSAQTGMPPPNLPNPGAQDLATSPDPGLGTTSGGAASPGMTTTTGVTTAAPGTMTTVTGTGTSATPSGVPGTETVTGNSATSATIPNSTSATILDPTATRDTTASSGPNARAPVPIETSGGSASPTMGANGKDMPECMSAWDNKTHISKVRWHEICQRTLNDPAHL
jgi:hypothetical protein